MGGGELFIRNKRVIRLAAAVGLGLLEADCLAWHPRNACARGR